MVDLFAFIGLWMCAMLYRGGFLVLGDYYADYFVCLLGSVFIVCFGVGF